MFDYEGSHHQENGDGELDEDQRVAKAKISGSPLIATAKHFDRLDRCQKECRVHLITTEAQKLGYKCFVVPGGAMVFNIAKKYKPRGVVAVACFNELKEGAARSSGDYNVPFQLIPLLKDGCVNTDVDVETVKHILNKSSQKSAS